MALPSTRTVAPVGLRASRRGARSPARGRSAAAVAPSPRRCRGSARPARIPRWRRARDAVRRGRAGPPARPRPRRRRPTPARPPARPRPGTWRIPRAARWAEERPCPRAANGRTGRPRWRGRRRPRRSTSRPAPRRRLRRADRPSPRRGTAAAAATDAVERQGRRAGRGCDGIRQGVELGVDVLHLQRRDQRAGVRIAVGGRLAERALEDDVVAGGQVEVPAAGAAAGPR